MADRRRARRHFAVCVFNEGYEASLERNSVYVVLSDPQAEKDGEYLQTWVRLVWVIDPQRRTAAVHRSLTEVRQLAAQDFLDGEDVLPGFRCRLDEAIG